jgi:hypothetical protein
MFSVMCFAHVNDANCTTRPTNFVYTTTLGLVLFGAEISAALLTQVESPPSCIVAQGAPESSLRDDNTCSSRFLHY